MNSDTIKAWPARNVELRALSKLTPYAKNARTHSSEQIAQIAKLITAYGWTNPILVDESGGIIAGHGRVLAAQRLGIVDVPVMVAAGWTKDERRAYVLADNASAAQAGWDRELLKIELGELQLEGYDLELTGFSPGELAGLLDVATEGLTDPDDVPDPEPAISVSGDIWIMGRHRLMCGDSTNPQHVGALMQDKRADLCFTSPPYAQQRDYKGGVGDWDTLMNGVFGILPVTDEAQILVNLGLVHRDGEWMPYWDSWIEWMRSAGWRRFGWYVWDQGAGMAGDWGGRLAPSHEWVFHFNRVAERPNKTKEKLPENITLSRTVMRKKDGTIGKNSNPQSGLQTHKIPDSVIRINRHMARGIERAHPAVFPVDLVSEMLTAFSDPDDIVYEPFCGSGTQLISAQKNGRTCCAMELAPEYTDVAVRRWQNFSGQTATNERTGHTFERHQRATEESRAAAIRAD